MLFYEPIRRYFSENDAEANRCPQDFYRGGNIIICNQKKKYVKIKVCYLEIINRTGWTGVPWILEKKKKEKYKNIWHRYGRLGVLYINT